MRKLHHHEIVRPSADELARLPRHPIVAVLDNVRSIHNVGSIFRTSDCARIRKLYLTGITGTPEHRALRKTALGAEHSVPWEYRDDALTVVRELKAIGFTIAALEITDSPISADCVERDLFPLCLIVGNELHGVDDRLVSCSDIALEIPQYGAKQSLNASVAYGIAVYDLVRRYRILAPTSRQPPQ